MVVARPDAAPAASRAIATPRCSFVTSRMDADASGGTPSGRIALPCFIRPARRPPAAQAENRRAALDAAGPRP